QEITLEDIDFGVQISGVVKLGSHVSRVFKIDQVVVWFVDRNATGGSVDRCHFQGCDRHDAKYREQTSNDRPLSFDKNTEVFASRGLLGRKPGGYLQRRRVELQ